MPRHIGTCFRFYTQTRVEKTNKAFAYKIYTLESGIDVGQGITVGPGKFVKKNKHRALNKRRA